MVPEEDIGKCNNINVEELIVMKRPWSKSDEDSTDDSETSEMCEVCGLNLRKYRCPRCEMLTCSLPCCLKHKSVENCNGRRDMAKFIGLSNFTTSDLRSDYMYLEDVLRGVDRAKRCASKYSNKEGTNTESKQKRKKFRRQPNSGALKNGVVSSGFERGFPQPHGEWLDQHPFRLKKLVQQANSIGINLLLMPQGMSRRESNTTKIAKKSNTILWRIEWMFCLNDSYHSVESDNIDDSKKFIDVLRGLLREKSGNAPLRHQLKEYSNAPLENVHLFIKLFRSGLSSLCYSRLDVDATIQLALRGHTIIEYPTIFVCMSHDIHRFPTLVAELPDSKKMENEESEASSSESETTDNDKLLDAQASGDFLAALAEIELMPLEKIKEIEAAFI